MSIVVYAESANGKYKKASLEAVSYAKALADQMQKTVVAFSINATDDSSLLYKYGAEKVVQIQSSGLTHFSPFVYSNAVQSLDADLYILPSTNDSATIAPILAQQLDAVLITNVVDIPTSVSPFQVKRKAFSGKGIETLEAVAGGKIVLTVLQNSYGLKENPTQGKEEVLDFQAGTPKVIVQKEESNQSDKIDLKEAEIVVSAGRGLKGAENWGMIEELAEILGAATACSKPVSDIGWRPHSEHVGQTGKAISPNLYIAIGISGAIQHLAGVNSSKNIVVINTDNEAPFFKAADYGIVGDAFEIIPKLIEEIKALKT